MLQVLYIIWILLRGRERTVTYIITNRERVRILYLTVSYWALGSIKTSNNCGKIGKNYNKLSDRWLCLFPNMVAVQVLWDIARCMLTVVHHNAGISMSGVGGLFIYHGWLCYHWRWGGCVSDVCGCASTVEVCDGAKGKLTCHNVISLWGWTYTRHCSVMMPITKSPAGT